MRRPRRRVLPHHALILAGRSRASEPATGLQEGRRRAAASEKTQKLSAQLKSAANDPRGTAKNIAQDAANSAKLAIKDEINAQIQAAQDKLKDELLSAAIEMKENAIESVKGLCIEFVNNELIKKAIDKLQEKATDALGGLDVSKVRGFIENKIIDIVDAKIDGMVRRAMDIIFNEEKAEKALEASREKMARALARVGEKAEIAVAEVASGRSGLEVIEEMATSAKKGFKSGLVSGVTEGLGVMEGAKAKVSELASVDNLRAEAQSAIGHKIDEAKDEANTAILGDGLKELIFAEELDV